MITKEYGKFFGACDLCDDETPRFNEWGECRNYMHNNHWQNTKNKETGEWENYCPDCIRKFSRKKTLQDFD